MTPFEFKYNSEKDYLHVAASGDISVSVIKAYFDQLQPILDETGTARLLIDDENATLRVSSMDIFAIARLVAFSPGAHCKRALVSRRRQVGSILYEAAAQAQNQNVRVFDCHNKAVEWLIQDH